MKMLKLLSLIAVGLFAVATLVPAQAGHGGVMQTWFTKDNKSKVQIYKCGEMICGKFVWLKEPLDDSGKPKIDKNNEDEDQRGKPIIGLVMLKDFVEDMHDNHKWVGGTIYDPENGKTYSSQMTLENDSTLNVRGYVGIPLFGRSQEWVKVD